VGRNNNGVLITRKPAGEMFNNGVRKARFSWGGRNNNGVGGFFMAGANNFSAHRRLFTV